MDFDNIKCDIYRSEIKLAPTCLFNKKDHVVSSER